MSQIYISAETRKKMDGSAEYGKEKLLLDSFNPNRKIKNRPTRQETISSPKKEKRHTSIVHKITDEEWEKIKQNANRQGYEAEIKRRLEEKRKVDALIKNYGVASDKVKKKKHRKKLLPGTPRPVAVKGKKNPLRLRDDCSKPLHDTTGKDYYDFAGEYASRSVEFGHGRKKSKEWQGAHVSGTGGSIDRMRSIKRSDPNVFDRQAMK